MPALKHHAELIRKLVNNHVENIHGQAIENNTLTEINKDTPKPLAKPKSAEQASVYTLPHRKP